ncbi:MAG: cardiolipin synthase [Planctomycetota bacterium]|nr:MAG: cardiolipin synthase [Planctomycetota bacterium]
METDWTGIFGLGALVLNWGIIVGLGFRIIIKRRPAGVSLAWLTIIVVVPFVGALLYLLVGELWLAGWRVRRARILGEPYRQRLAELRQESEAHLHHDDHLARVLDAYGSRGIGSPTLTGNTVQIHSDAGDAFAAMVHDIDHAARRCLLLFYIWHPGGRSDEIAEALIRAADRGVECRVLLDAVGSSSFFGSSLCRRLRSAGVEVTSALPVGRFRSLLARIDLRNHRKIIAIDGRIGYCGSLNLADPKYFKPNKGPWIDMMARVEGPAAEALELIIQHDLWLEHGRDDQVPFEDVNIGPYRPGNVAIQVVSSGPGQSPRAMQDMLLTMVYSAETELIITTPYFIPSESMLAALVAAARRGVRVTIVVPERVDSPLVQFASRAYFNDLLDENIRLLLFRGGLLHAKTMSADRQVCMFGSANLDRRSFGVNFETSMFIYDRAVTEQLVALQQSYMNQSIEVAEPFRKRGPHRRLLENATQLLAPLL